MTTNDESSFLIDVFESSSNSKFTLTITPSSTAEQLRFRAVAWLVAEEKSQHDIYVESFLPTPSILGSLRESDLSPYETVKLLRIEQVSFRFVLLKVTQTQTTPPQQQQQQSQTQTSFSNLNVGGDEQLFPMSLSVNLQRKHSNEAETSETLRASSRLILFRLEFSLELMPLCSFVSGNNIGEKAARIAARFSTAKTARRPASPARLNASKASTAYYTNILTTLGADDVATYAKDSLFMNYLVQLLVDVKKTVVLFSVFISLFLLAVWWC